MKNIYLFLLSLLIIAMVMGGCKTEEFADNPISDQSNGIGNLNKHATTPGPVQQLLSGLEGASGSSIGPGEALFVTEGALGRISRVNLKTGDLTTLDPGRWIWRTCRYNFHRWNCLCIGQSRQ